MATTRAGEIAQAEISMDVPDAIQHSNELDEHTQPLADPKKDGKETSLSTTQISISIKEHPLTDVYDGDGSLIVEPTAEELITLRRVADKIPYAAFSVVIVELCERFAYYGLSGPFQNYLQNPLPAGSRTGAPLDKQGAPGALNRSQSEATGLQNMFSFLAYITPILGAIIADAKWGRFKTITFACGIYFSGLLIMTLTSIPSALARGAGLPGWIVGALVVAAGTGGIKSNVSPLVADQYRHTKMRVETRKGGERVIVDPNLTITRIYNLFYWCINVGSLSAIATTESERQIGFWLAFTIPTAVFLITPVVLVVSRNWYYKVPPKGSVVLDTWRCVRVAVGQSGFWASFGGMRRVGREEGGLWKYAKPSYYTGVGGGGDGSTTGVGVGVGVGEDGEKGTMKQTHTPKSMKRFKMITWDDVFVDEVKRTLRACQIFVFYPLYWISYNQITTNLISQAATMKLNGTPNDLVQNFDAIALIIFIPIMDLLVYPFLRRCGFVARPIFRIWLGFMFGTMAMIYAAVLQHYIYVTNPCGSFPSNCTLGPSTISVWVQVPAYVLIAISEIFASITGLEYSYNKAPKRMKSVVVSIFLFMTALGNAINAALSPVAEDPKLVWNYTGIAIASFIAGNIFYLCFHKRDSIEEEENLVGKEQADSDSSLGTGVRDAKA